ncbi:MAG: TerB family tellurite resistance protein [Pseudomonadota bacterium]
MMLKWLSDKITGQETGTLPEVTPEIGAAALLIEDAHRDDHYSEIERDLATSAIMKLFNLSNPEAVAMRRDAEEAQGHSGYIMRFCVAAQKLDADTKERLVTHLWAIIDSDQEETVAESMLVNSVIDMLGISRERARALRLPPLTPEK